MLLNWTQLRYWHFIAELGALIIALIHLELNEYRPHELNQN